MRITLGFIFFLLSAQVAWTQVCSGCGCKGGSGWRAITIASQKCTGCSEVAKRCGTPATEKCVFEGCANIQVVRLSCPEHIPDKACGLK
jgi:hypothetical protein